VGGAAFRFHSLHEDENDRSLQRFVQQTGRRGQRYLQKMDLSAMLNRIETV
jgi:hypothetical protein